MAKNFGDAVGGQGNGDGDQGNGDRKRPDKSNQGRDAGRSGRQGNGSNGELIESADPLPLPDPTNEGFQEDAEESRHLYLEFLRDEFQRQHLSQETAALLPQEDEMVRQRLDWTRAGRELRHIADAFSRSQERENVRQRARSIDVQALDFESFLKLLQELFNGEGITQERILVLFFFCADVCIEALKRGFSQSFPSLITWSLQFIATRVAQWVHNHGGWGAILRSSLTVAYQVSACFAFVAFTVACVVYIRRNLG